jgi:hypothetical protein
MQKNKQYIVDVTVSSRTLSKLPAPLLSRRFRSLPFLPFPIHLLFDCFLAQSLDPPFFLLSPRLVPLGLVIYNLISTLCTTTQRHVLPFLVVSIHLISPPLVSSSSSLAPTDIDIHAWGNSEPECLSYLCKVKCIDVKYLL